MQILIVGPAWVGDMVMAQSLFMLLRQKYPGAMLDVLAPAWSVPLLARMPEVRHAIELPAKHGEFGWGIRRRIGVQLRAQRYNWALVLPITWKSALVPFFANIPKRSGFRGELRYGLLNDIHTLDKQRLPMMVQRYLALGLAQHAPLPAIPPMPRLSASAVSRAQTLTKLGLSLGPALALCPGAEYGPAKRWPAAYFRVVAEAYAARGWHIWILGSTKDAEVAAEIARDHAAWRNLTGATTLAEAVDVLSAASLVISNDSGLMHVAAAVDVPVVAVYGSSDIRYTPPLSTRARVVSLGLSCSPCFKKVCPFGHYRCLQDLTPERVLQESAIL
ncbi:MAG: lipopolysaccharide heptosyltransferase II [Pseudomonadota bacterium]